MCRQALSRYDMSCRLACYPWFQKPTVWTNLESSPIAATAQVQRGAQHFKAFVNLLAFLTHLSNLLKHVPSSCPSPVSSTRAALWPRFRWAAAPMSAKLRLSPELRREPLLRSLQEVAEGDHLEAGLWKMESASAIQEGTPKD